MVSRAFRAAGWSNSAIHNHPQEEKENDSNSNSQLGASTKQQEIETGVAMAAAFSSTTLASPLAALAESTTPPNAAVVSGWELLSSSTVEMLLPSIPWLVAVGVVFKYITFLENTVRSEIKMTERVLESKIDATEKILKFEIDATEEVLKGEMSVLKGEIEQTKGKIDATEEVLKGEMSVLKGEIEQTNGKIDAAESSSRHAGSNDEREKRSRLQLSQGQTRR